MHGRATSSLSQFSRSLHFQFSANCFGLLLSIASIFESKKNPPFRRIYKSTCRLGERLSRFQRQPSLSSMSHCQDDEMERMTALAAADALVGLARAGGEVTDICAASEKPTNDEEQDAFSAPIITEEEELREKQQLSLHEIQDIESDLRGITKGMDTMSISAGGVNGGSSGVGAAPTYRDGRGTGHLSSWRNQDEIQRDLNLLDEEIERIPVADKAAYLMAMQRCPAEAFGGWRWDFFLEQRDFDAKRMAKTLVEYWKTRLALFGEERCFLPMTLAGAMRDEVTVMMKYEPHRISPVKDTAGRTVMVADPSRRERSLYTLKSTNRAFWYELEVIAQDPEARRCGVVIIVNNKNAHPGHFDPRFAHFAVSAVDLFPMPWRAIHYVNTNILVSRIVIPSLKFILGKRLRNRLIVHTGTSSNVIDDMRSYALPPDRLPKEFGGEVVVDMHAWIYERYVEEVLNLAVPGPNMERNVEPTTKGIRREVLPDVPTDDPPDVPPDAPKGSGDISADMFSLDHISHPGQPGDHRDPLSLSSMSDIQMTQQEATLLGQNIGRLADPRIKFALILKLRNPDMDNFDVLTAAGLNVPLLTAVENSRLPLASSAAVAQFSDGSTTRRLRTEDNEVVSSAPVPFVSAIGETDGSGKGRAKGKVRGKRSDPRMSRAIEAKLADDDLSLYDALVAGGFVFKEDISRNDLVDSDGIALKQRKNNLCRRLRIEKGKRAKQDSFASDDAQTSG